MTPLNPEIITKIEQMSEAEIKEIEDFVQFLAWKKYQPSSDTSSLVDHGALVKSVKGDMTVASESGPSLSVDHWHQALEMLTKERLSQLRTLHQG